MSDPRTRAPARTLRWRPLWWLAALLIASVGAAGAWWSRGDDVDAKRSTIVRAATNGTYIRRETRPTLDPAQFVGKAATTHQIARDIPDVLDHLYCYCECDKHVGHKSLLSCYTDNHAPT